MIAFLQQDRGSYYASTPEVYSSYKQICAFDVPAPPVLCTVVACLSIAMRRRNVFGCIDKVEMSVLSFGAFLAVIVGPMN